MKTLLHEASAADASGLLMGVMTLLFLAFFCGWVWYAYSPRFRARHDHHARIPFGEPSDGSAERTPSSRPDQEA